MASDNRTLGKFILDGIPPAHRGIPQIEVIFDIDANGILHVKALDKATNKEQSIKIEASSGLSEEEVEKMRQDAEVHAEEDKKKKELVETRNLAEQLIFTTEKTLKDLSDAKAGAGDKVTPDEKRPVEDAVMKLKGVKDGGDLEAIKKASEELSEAVQKIGEKLYSAAKEAEDKDKKEEDSVKDEVKSDKSNDKKTDEKTGDKSDEDKKE